MVGRLLKKYCFWTISFSKMCVLCMFLVDFELGGKKKIEVGIFLNKNLLW